MVPDVRADLRAALYERAQVSNSFFLASFLRFHCELHTVYKVVTDHGVKFELVK